MLNRIKPIYQVTFKGGGHIFAHVWLRSTAVRIAQKNYHGIPDTGEIRAVRIVGRGRGRRG